MTILLESQEQINQLNQATIHQTTELEKKLNLGRPLRIKYGIDPTAAHVHFGHTVGLLLLRKFQELGHKAVIIIGNYTAQIGDPTGRDKTRPRMSAFEIDQNAKKYLEQIGKIIKLDDAEVYRNGDWFGDMSFLNIIKLLGQATVSQILNRNDFALRMSNATPIFLHECVYPLMQAYDSLAIRADVEIGGTEQLFNLLLARDIQTKEGLDAQVCVTVPILRGLDGIKRMGKSLNNYIGIDEPSEEMYAKIMSIPDALMEEWWTLLPVDETSWASACLDFKTDNMGLKKALARRLTAFFHNQDSAKRAADAWHNRFSLRKDPDNIKELVLPPGKIPICKLLVQAGLVSSNNEARRIIAPPTGESGCTIGTNRERIGDPTQEIELEDGLIVRVGSKKIAKIKLLNNP